MSPFWIAIRQSTLKHHQHLHGCQKRLLTASRWLVALQLLHSKRHMEPSYLVVDLRLQ